MQQRGYLEMEELIVNIAGKFGIDQAMAEKAVGILMSLVRNNADEGAVSQLFDQLPGASDLAEKYAADAEGGSGGGLMGKLGGLLGGNMGAAMGALGALKSTGLDMDQIKGVGSEVFEYAREKADTDLANDVIKQVAGNIPGLDKLL